MERKVQRKWHDESLNITKYGLGAMRVLLIAGAILGFLLGLSTMYLIIGV